jgi:peptidoglycan-associated lipoprotein
MMTKPNTTSRYKFVACWAALLSALVLAGCSSVKLDDKETPIESRVPAKAGGADANASQTGVAPVDLTQNAGGANANAAKVVYFDYDSYALKDEYRPVVETHAKTLNSDPRKRMQIEGHTDERGGREYNLALGQKRAEVVAKALNLLGATGTQVEAVSFGKERPATPATTKPLTLKTAALS